MSNSIKIYLALLATILILVLIIDSNESKPIDWRPSYKINEKKPLGLYIFDKEVSKLLKNNTIHKISSTAYEFLTKVQGDTISNLYLKKGTIFNISENTTIDDESVRQLLFFAENGNNIFLSMKSFPESLLDSLKIDYSTENSYTKNVKNWVSNKSLGNNKYILNEGVGFNYFSKIDTLNTTVLGYQSIDSTRVNFIKIAYKSGTFFLHTQPATFTNFYLLKNKNHEYAEKILSYVPEGNVYWFLRFKNYDDDQENSIFRVILEEPALRSAWYLFLFGLLIFMLFNAKRKQRIVPIIKPLQNTTVDFVKTIGNLYYQEGDHDNIIQKKIIYFLEKIRHDYLIETTTLDEQFIKRLHQKSGKDITDIKELVYLINKHKKNKFLSIEKDLIDINKAIEKFFSA